MSPFQSGFLGGFIIGGLVLFVVMGLLWLRTADLADYPRIGG